MLHTMSLLLAVTMTLLLLLDAETMMNHLLSVHSHGVSSLSVSHAHSSRSPVLSMQSVLVNGGTHGMYQE